MDCHLSVFACDSSSASFYGQQESSSAICAVISAANTFARMEKRRPLTNAEQAAAGRLMAIYKQRKAEASERGERLTQDDVAVRCGWSGQSAFGQYARGVVPLNLKALLALSKVLRFDPSEVSPELASAVLPLGSQFQVDKSTKGDESNVEPGPPIVSPFRAVKILGTAQMGSEGYWTALDEADGVDMICAGDGSIRVRWRDSDQ